MRKMIALAKMIIVTSLILAAAVVCYALVEGEHPDYFTTYAGVYNEIYGHYKSDEARRTFAELIDDGFEWDYARRYAKMIDSGKSTAYAGAYAYASMIESGRLSDHAYAETIDIGYPYWYAYTYASMIESGRSTTYAHAYTEMIESGRSTTYAHAYASMIESGRSLTYARTYTDARFVYFLNEEDALEIAKTVDSEVSVTLSALSPIDTAVVLAMYSTTDDTEADKRAASVREMTTYVGRGDMDNDTALGLLSDIAPGASIDERVEAASRLASISDNSDGELTPEQTMEVANELTRLITGHGIDAEQRAGAAREMVRLSQSGELNADNAAELMDTIAPEWSVTERKEALGYLALQFSEGEWDADSAQRTATEQITSNPDWYATIYAEQIIAGRSDSYARIYAKQVVADKSSTYAHAYTEQIVSGKSGTYASIYAWLVYLIS